LYAGAAGQTASDEAVMATALAGAMQSSRRGDRGLLEVVAQWLGGDPPRAAPVGQRRQERHRARVRFQQLSAPTAAKSVEDTAFYRYGRLLSRNEVGSSPAVFATSVAHFHTACAERLATFPRALLATATHDHKRGEDVRARLAVISEWPDAWATLVAAISDALPIGGVDPGDWLMLLQMLVAAWPVTLDCADDSGAKAFRDRIAVWQQKALREAKLRTDWATPNPNYEAACDAALTALLAPGATRKAIAEFAGRLAIPGAINALSQTFLRLTTPGIPDLYQGAVRWDESLVDPDNRRPPDFTALRNAGELELANWRNGAIKQALIAGVLRYRQSMPDLFAEGRYEPLIATGPCAAHVVAFLRVRGRRRVLAAAVRLPGALIGDATTPKIAPEQWNSTELELPTPGRGVNLLTGRNLDACGGLQDLFAQLPVALVALD
jgi:(1->4)-alpha-D-glucan 1-alpha-D-glucosylmutase